MDYVLFSIIAFSCSLFYNGLFGTSLKLIFNRGQVMCAVMPTGNAANVPEPDLKTHALVPDKISLAMHLMPLIPYAIICH